MSPRMYVDDYACLDIYYLVNAYKVDPCEDNPDDHEYLIAGILHVAQQAIPLHLVYPAAGYRDAAFEAIVALVKQEQARAVLEEDEDV